MQVAVGRVQLDDLEAGLERPAGRARERLDDLADRRDREGLGIWWPSAKGMALGASIGFQPPCSAASGRPPLPRQVGARLAAGVGQLDPRHRALALDEAGDARQRFDVLVLPDAEVAGADAPFGRHRAGLGHHQARAPHGAGAQVHEMPVVGEPVLATSTRTWARRRCDCGK